MYDKFPCLRTDGATDVNLHTIIWRHFPNLFVKILVEKWTISCYCKTWKEPYRSLMGFMFLNGKTCEELKVKLEHLVLVIEGAHPKTWIKSLTHIAPFRFGKNTNLANFKLLQKKICLINMSYILTSLVLKMVWNDGMQVPMEPFILKHGYLSYSPRKFQNNGGK